MLDERGYDLHSVHMSAAATILDDSFTYDVKNNCLTVHAKGDWSFDSVGRLDKAVTAMLGEADYTAVRYDLSDVSHMDTAGAYVLARAVRGKDNMSDPWTIIGGKSGQEKMIEAAAQAAMGKPPKQTRPWYDALSRLGYATTNGTLEVYNTIAFFGRVLSALFNMILRPHRVRWKSVVALIEQVGLDALPIVMMLSFFIGCVIAFMGAELLATFGFDIFLVDLVGLSVLREFAVLIMAIMMAARSNSAFTAQIGSMVMRQEVDAMTVIGLDTDETLVAPRALACLVSAPILTFAGMVSGIIGGAIVAKFANDISFNAFFVRIGTVISIDHFWVGMIKAPVFALVIATIGCRQGLAVKGSVDSLGQRTTASVVQAIFAVIVLDAMFAMFFLEIDY